VPRNVPRLLETEGDVAVLFALPRGVFTDLVLTFPLVNDKGQYATNWYKKLSFPRFFRNVLYVLGKIRDGSAEKNVPPGEIIALQPSAAVKEVVVTLPDRKEIKLKSGPAGDFSYKDTEQVGVYQVDWKGGQRLFAVNLHDPDEAPDVDESDVQPRDEVRIGAQRLAASAGRNQTRETWKWVAVAALVLLVVEWGLYHRRIFT
jgi:hypothetical protein